MLPSLLDKKPKTEVIHLGVTPPEVELIDQLAERAGVSRSEMLRRLVRHALPAAELELRGRQ